MARVDIVVPNQAGPGSWGNEVWLLAAVDRRGERLELAFSPDWERVEDARLTDDCRGGPFHKSERASLAIVGAEVAELFFLSHKWSGYVDVACGPRVHRIDLAAETPRIVAVDPRTARMRTPGRIEVREVLAGELGGREVATERTAERIEVTIAPETGAIALVAIRQGGRMLDLEDIALPETGWRFEIANDAAAEAEEVGVLVGVAGELNLALAAECELLFRRAPGAGVVTIRSRTREMRIDLAGEKGVVAAPLTPFSATPRTNALARLPRSANPHVPTFDPTRPLALFLPRWKGVAMSTRMLFEQSMEISPTEVLPEELESHDIVRYAEQLLVTGCRHFVISGGDLFWHEVIERVQAADPGVRFDLLWHSNFVQIGEGHDWKLWRRVLEAHRAGRITRIGVVKEGYDVFLSHMGVDAVFIPNVVQVDIDTIAPSDCDDSVGVWLSGSSQYRKPALPSLMALAMLDKYALRGSGLGREGLKAVAQLGLRTEGVHADAIPEAQLHREIAQTAATLYVTLSECSPMLPLESMALGVPCLVGPASHLFRRHAALREWLVVEDPMNAALIARKLDRAVDERDAIVAAYRGYAGAEAERARQAVARLLA